ncbi:MAG: hypothetical protein RLY58_1340 [Pseudomonadota bacterium]
MPKQREPATLQGCLLELMEQVQANHQQWIEPLRHIIQLLDHAQYPQAQHTWQSLLRPMRGSFHGFFVCCDDLDQMRQINMRIDHLRDRVTCELDQLVSV